MTTSWDRTEVLRSVVKTQPADLSFNGITPENFKNLVTLYDCCRSNRIERLDNGRFSIMKLSNPKEGLGIDHFKVLVDWEYKCGIPRRREERVEKRNLLLKANGESDIQLVTRLACERLPDRTGQALDILMELPGVDITLATLILSVFSPGQHPFWSIELAKWASGEQNTAASLEAIPTTKGGYLYLKKAVERMMKRLELNLNQNPWRALDVEMAAYSRDTIKAIHKSYLEDFGPIQRGDVLGRGGQSMVVYEANADKINGGNAFAMKSISFDQSTPLAFLNEVSIIHDLSNEYIVEFYGWTFDTGHYRLAMELMSKTLSVCLGGQKSPCRWKDTFRKIEPQRPISQILCALKYMHERGFTHRDLKPDNIFVTKDGNIKVADFGITKRARNGYDTTMETNIGTRGFLAPEVLRNSRTFHDNYSKKVDTWSLGCILYWMIKGKLLFSSDAQALSKSRTTWDRVRLARKVGFFHNKGETIGLLPNLVCICPEKRYSVTEALKHPWLEQDTNGRHGWPGSQIEQNGQMVLEEDV